jgi:hypothetical protein
LNSAGSKELEPEAPAYPRCPRPNRPEGAGGMFAKVAARRASQTASIRRAAGFSPRGHRRKACVCAGRNGTYTTRHGDESRERLEMRGVNFGRWIALSACVLVFAVVFLPVSAQAAAYTSQTAPGSQKLKFVVPKPVTDVFGSPVVFSARLSGSGEANHRIELQASPYPFVEPFANIGTPGVTDRLGRFAFRIVNLTANTQLRVVTLDALPIYSRVVIVDVAVRVSFSARSSGSDGLVRLYGTVMPAVEGAKVYFQLLQPVRPRTNEESRRYVSQFVTPLKLGSQKFSSFSLVVKLHKSGRYRVFVKAPRGPVVSGFSARSLVLHAPPVGPTI